MGNYFQTVIDLDATQADAGALAVRGLEWLVAEGIVRGEKTDCVLGAPLGHPPGVSWSKVVEREDEGWEPYGGLSVETGRTVFNCGQGDPGFAVCPCCAGQVRFCTDQFEEIDGAWEPFREAMSVWHETGRAVVGCPLCRRDGDLTAWGWSDGYFAFGCLGFEFWDWPELGAGFLRRFGEALGGHRTAMVAGKL